jgi:hypothetical protein
VRPAAAMPDTEAPHTAPGFIARIIDFCGRKRFFAQRPLPSMMMATCLGTVDESGIVRVELLKEAICQILGGSLDGHQFGFFLREQLVDFRDVLVGEFLHIVLRPALVVLGALLLLERSFSVTLASRRRCASPGVLAFVFDHLIRSRRSSVSAGMGTRINSPA